ncbi:hypothetical protein Tco_0795833 [Tanacetum coccineum]
MYPSHLVLIDPLKNIALKRQQYVGEFIEFGDSYKAPLEESGKGIAGEGFAKKKGRIVAITAEDMQNETENNK